MLENLNTLRSSLEMDRMEDIFSQQKMIVLDLLAQLRVSLLDIVMIVNNPGFWA